MGALRKRGTIWWIRYCRNGKRYDESSRSSKKTDAITLLKLREGDGAKGVPVTPKVGRLTFDEAAADLLAEYRTNGRRSLKVTQRRVNKHLLPYFRGHRMNSITAATVRSYIDHRQKQGVTDRQGQRRADVSNAEINRETALLKRMFTLAVQAGKLLHRPYIPKLQERNARAGFFEPQQFVAVRALLPSPVDDFVEFGYITGWRIDSEVLPLEWRQVDFTAGEIRLDPNTTKNGKARTFPMTDDLRTLLERRQGEAKALKRKKDLIVPWVFYRMVAKGRGGEKRPVPVRSFRKAWRMAVRAAGCPGRVPHDLRRTAIRNMVRRGVPERVAMQLAGHETRSVFERYNIVSTGDLKTAAEQLSGLTGTKMGQSAFQTADPSSRTA